MPARVSSSDESESSEIEESAYSQHDEGNKNNSVPKAEAKPVAKRNSPKKGNNKKAVQVTKKIRKQKESSEESDEEQSESAPAKQQPAKPKPKAKGKSSSKKKASKSGSSKKITKKKKSNGNSKSKGKQKSNKNNDDLDEKEDYMPGQIRPSPEENDSERVFYESLYEQRPDSEMAQQWCLKHGLLPLEDAERLVKQMNKKKK